MMRGLRVVLVVCLAVQALVWSDRAGACSADSDCEVGDRTYRLRLPDSRDGGAAVGAIVFLHGYRGKSAGVMRNKAMLALADRLGVALVALQSIGDDWSLPRAPSSDIVPGVDEAEYLDAVMEDLAGRADIDRERVVIAVFSSGGMGVWHLACYRGGSFAGFVAMSGTFWKPEPEACPSPPAKLIHYHGAQDKIVPMQGRQIKDAMQGDVLKSMEMLAATGSYGAPEDASEDGLECTRWSGGEGGFLELCQFDGKHAMKTAHVERAWDLIVGGRQ
jgi:polyhydroxybutyrate depolymerase